MKASDVTRAFASPLDSPAYAPARYRFTDREYLNITVKSAFRGPARLELFAHALAPLADLPVLEVVSASHIRTDLTLDPAEPVHDYLAR